GQAEGHHDAVPRRGGRADDDRRAVRGDAGAGDGVHGAVAVEADRRVEAAGGGARPVDLPVAVRVGRGGRAVRLVPGAAGRQARPDRGAAARLTPWRMAPRERAEPWRPRPRNRSWAASARSRGAVRQGPRNFPRFSRSTGGWGESPARF